MRGFPLKIQIETLKSRRTSNHQRQRQEAEAEAEVTTPRAHNSSEPEVEMGMQENLFCLRAQQQKNRKEENVGKTTQ